MVRTRVVGIGVTLLGGLLLVAVPLRATNIPAASASRTDVQQAIDLAESGDSVTVPPGNAVWSIAVAIPDSKKITLRGSGVDITTITGAAVDMGESGSRVTGFRFNGGTVVVAGYGWRVDHCMFYHADTGGTGIHANGIALLAPCPTGVVDHCTFYNRRVVVFGYAESNWTEGKTRFAHYQWYVPLGLGTDNAVFIEECDFTRTSFGNAVDSGPGGRYVFRYNTVTDAYIEAHSSQEGRRACRSWEIYNNTITRSSVAVYMPFRLRGGTGVVHDNTLTGSFTINRIGLDNIRTFSDEHYPGIADGTKPWDGNTLPIETYAGWPARDQIGRGGDESLWTTENPYPTQTSEPAYFWNNKRGSDDVTPLVINSCEIHIQEGRDYFVGIARPGYTAYAYPHPLIGEWDERSGSGAVQGPTPPSGLRISQ